MVDIANSTHILKTVIHGTKKDEEDPKYFLSESLQPSSISVSGLFAMENGTMSMRSTSMEATQKMYTDTFKRKIFKTH